jgi:hypothetical protein
LRLPVAAPKGENKSQSLSDWPSQACSNSSALSLVARFVDDMEQSIFEMEFKFHFVGPSRPSRPNRPVADIRIITIWSKMHALAVPRLWGCPSDGP